MSEPLEEFRAEVQEIIEALSRDLLVLDQNQKDGVENPALLNEIFRGVHTLKGIAGMFGFERLGALAHMLEDLLDSLRLDRLALSAPVLDVLFEGVEGFHRLSVDEKDPTVDLTAVTRQIDELTKKARRRTKKLYDLEESVLAVMTEYEEHRLFANASAGLFLYRIQAAFDFDTIDADLQGFKDRAGEQAEVITYLPSGEGSFDSKLELDILLASRLTTDEVMERFDIAASAVTQVPFRAEPSDWPKPLIESSTDLTTTESDNLLVRGVANSVRVDIRKLDHLMNVVGELAIIRATVAQLTEAIRSGEGRRAVSELQRLGRTFERQLEDLQTGILDVRMVPLGQLFDRLARVVRQVAREHRKEVHLEVSGVNTEVDKLIVEELADPLMHLIRNSIDHGIETPRLREKAGKPQEGRLTLSAFQKGSHVIIELRDDGSGLNEEFITKRAIDHGLLTEEAASEMPKEAIWNLIFIPGFSTRAEITDISGRGFGMDVVKTNISRLGGVIELDSKPGRGTRFTINLPVTLAIINALIVEIGDSPYALPLASVQEAVPFDPSMLHNIDGDQVISLRDTTLPVCDLRALFSKKSNDDNTTGEDAAKTKRYCVVCAFGARRLGFIVDAIQGQRDIVIKALGNTLSNVRGFAGATDLGQQQVALVLDASGLVEEMLQPREKKGVLHA